MTSSHHGLYAQGDTRATMAGTEGSLLAIVGESSKAGPSSDCSLQPDYMKPESLVIADQPSCGVYKARERIHRSMLICDY